MCKYMEEPGSEKGIISVKNLNMCQIRREAIQALVIDMDKTGREKIFI